MNLFVSVHCIFQKRESLEPSSSTRWVDKDTSPVSFWQEIVLCVQLLFEAFFDVIGINLPTTIDVCLTMSSFVLSLCRLCSQVFNPISTLNFYWPQITYPLSLARSRRQHLPSFPSSHHGVCLIASLFVLHLCHPCLSFSTLFLL